MKVININGVSYILQPKVNPKTQDQKKFYEAAKKFEALFVKEMLKSMRATLNPKMDILYGGLTQEIFTSMLDNQYASLAVKNANFGIADAIYNFINAETTESP